MMLLIAVYIVISIFVALAMGVSGFSVSFAPSYGSKILRRSTAVILYSLCILAGGILIGPRVVNTLAENISTRDISVLSGVIILFSAGFMMFLSNAMRIPQSTSFVAVASFVGAGLYYGNVNWNIIMKIGIAALIFSLLSFIVAFIATRVLHPFNRGNARFHDYFRMHRGKFRALTIFINMYAAFGMGTNNIPNVVAPLVGSTQVNPVLALAIAAPLFGIGAFMWGRGVMNTISKEIVPINEGTAFIISATTATFVIIASLMGLPTPYVQLTALSVLAVSCIKKGARHALSMSLIRRSGSLLFSLFSA
jgi:sulfate permease